MSLSGALIGAVIGSVGTGIAGFLLQKHREKRQRERLEEALIAELEVIGEILEICEEENILPSATMFSTEVYESNTANLGHLDFPEDVVRFYSLLLSELERLKESEHDAESIHESLVDLDGERECVVSLLKS